MQKLLKKLYYIFENSFINPRTNELILEPKNNCYFNLSDIKTKEDLIWKFISYVSRNTHKGLTKKWHKYYIERFNKFLGTNFNIKDLNLIYTFFGNGCNKQECYKFILSEYNMNILYERAEKEGFLDQINKIED